MKGIVYKKRAKVFLIKIIIVFFIFLITAGVFCYLGIVSFNSSDISASVADNERITVIIDPGHGGIDSGAQSNGIYEKNLNMQLALKTASFLKLYNIDCVLTRDSDVLLSDTQTNKKQSDLLNRVKKAKSYSKPVFVSIHMNKFPQEKYSGLQVFYSTNNNYSEDLAAFIQNNTALYLQPDNKRQTKPSGSSIFVLDRLECPAVLVECGFLSNHAELENLQNEEYQNKLAFVMSSSIIQFLKDYKV